MLNKLNIILCNVSGTKKQQKDSEYQEALKAAVRLAKINARSE